MALSPAKLARIQALVQLAGSPYEEEARTAAYQACKLMREERVQVADVVGMLPASPHAPAPPPAPAPARTVEDDPSWSMRRLSNQDLEEQHRMLGAVHNMTAAQLAAARRRLAEEQQRRLEEEARAQALAEQLARKNRILADIRRNNAAPRPAQGPVLPTGAGRREPW